MTGLLADGWFYISSAGLLVSGVLFFFLLSQYRAATDAADQSEPEASAETQGPIIRPLYIPDEPVSSPKVASFTADKPAEKAPAATASAPSEPKRDAAPAPADQRREAATSGVNPAVVYLQNIKNQLEEIHNENRELSKKMQAISGRDEALIERLSELAQVVAELKGASAPVPAPVEPPAPKRAKKNEAPPAAAPVVEIEIPKAAPVAAAPAAAPVNPLIEPTTVAGVPERKAEVPPEPAAETLFSAEEAARMALKPAVEAPPEPAAESSEGPDAGEKPRRGPVWPV